MKVIRDFDRPAYQAFYSVAGRLLFIEVHSLQLRRQIELLFSSWHLTPAPFTPSPDIRIRFTCGEPKLELPRHLNQFEIAGGGRCYTDGADFYLLLRDAVVHLVSGTPIAVNVSLARLTDSDDPLLATIVSFAICAALRRFGLFDLHSAGVVHPKTGKGILIVGASGSGKSTMALQLTRARWPYLSDDALLLNLEDGEVHARGFRRCFAVSIEAGSKFKTLFEPDVAFGCPRWEHASPGLLLFIRLAGEEKTRLCKLTQAETMMMLIKSCPWATYDTAVASANLEVLSVLARQATGFNLSAGRDLLVRGRAAELLSQCGS